MSLTVPPTLLKTAERDEEIKDTDFVACIRDSLPYAYNLVAGLAERLAAGDTVTDRTFADNQVEPPNEQARGELLRAMSSDAIKGALQRHFGVRLAFQNCHRVAVFPSGEQADKEMAIFTSVRAQLLNQSPELVNC